MKKQLLFALASVFTMSTYAQTNVPNMSGVNIEKPFDKVMITGNETGPSNRGTGGGNATAASANGTIIGTTTYDLQTNGSVQNRLIKHADGTVSAVWTYSNSFDITASDRGTGYNYYNGTSWSAAPIARIESERGGWPSISPINGGELNTLHNTTSSVITMNKRPGKGTGAWAESNITSPTIDLVWNRSAVGGANGQSIHMVGVTAPIALSGSLYQGLDGALVYYRSIDGGASWDQQAVVLPGMTSTEFIGFSGDSYSIMSKGNTVVIAVYSDWADSFIMKSTDNGSTWTKTLFIDFPLDLYVANQAGGSDANNDGTPDTLSSTDNSGSLVIDNNGMAHVFYGNMRILDADLTDAGTTYFPYTNGLLYWNENMPTDSSEFIAWAEDFDNDGVVQNVNETDIARYFTSLASFPNASVDANGAIYVAYSAYMENTSNGSQAYRHVYLVKSDDGGCSWNQFEDMTPNDNFAECIFPSIANVTDDSVRFIYQEDIEPGLAVRGDLDAFGDNDIVYVSTPVNGLNAAILNCVTWVQGDLEFCAGDTTTINASCGSSYSWSTGATTANMDVTNHGAISVDITTSCATTITHNLVTTSPSGPPVISTTGAQFVCGSTPVVIGVTPVSLGTYLWSTGATTQDITVAAAGTYTVTVSNCGGTASKAILLNTEPTPSDAITIIGNATICEGSGTVGLSAVEGASWLWSNGNTNRTITLSTPSESGSYTCEIYNSCGDMVTSSAIAITINPQPVQPVISYLGGAVYTSTTADGYQWYMNANIIPGETNQTYDASLYPNETISVIVSNTFGCLSAESAGYVVGVSEIKNTLNHINVYPNPNNGIFDISFSAAKSAVYEVKITNIVGQVLFLNSISISGSNNRKVDLSSFDNGLYFITISSEGEENTYKLVIE